MRTLAWWHTAPQPDKPKDETTSTRLEAERLRRKDLLWTPPLPFVEAPHLLGYFWEVGPTLPGNQALTFAEIEAWTHLAGLELEPWEARTLRRLSVEYVAETRRARARDAICPTSTELSAEDRKRISDGLAAGLRMLMSTRPNR